MTRAHTIPAAANSSYLIQIITYALLMIVNKWSIHRATCIVRLVIPGHCSCIITVQCAKISRIKNLRLTHVCWYAMMIHSIYSAVVARIRMWMHAHYHHSWRWSSYRWRRFFVAVVVVVVYNFGANCTQIALAKTNKPTDVWPQQHCVLGLIMHAQNTRKKKLHTENENPTEQE